VVGSPSAGPEQDHGHATQQARARLGPDGMRDRRRRVRLLAHAAGHASAVLAAIEAGRR
jgi:hypothetical protein